MNYLQQAPGTERVRIFYEVPIERCGCPIKLPLVHQGVRLVDFWVGCPRNLFLNRLVGFVFQTRVADSESCKSTEGKPANVRPMPNAIALSGDLPVINLHPKP